jgi:uncharacterized protein (DUF952 family)
MTMVFKICPAAEWAAARQTGHYAGSPADHRDGFIHLSAAGQVAETAARHFAGQSGLVLVAFEAEALPGLAWEPSRGGALFPHVHGVLPVNLARWVADLPVVDGRHVFPQELSR